MTIVACPVNCGGSINTAERNDCAACGASLLVTYGDDYPYGNPERCNLLTKDVGGGADPWGCHKRKGHATGNGGRHCSTHTDCGFYIGPSLICRDEPGHDNGIHEVASPLHPCHAKCNGVES